MMIFRVALLLCGVHAVISATHHRGIVKRESGKVEDKEILIPPLPEIELPVIAKRAIPADPKTPNRLADIDIQSILDKHNKLRENDAQNDGAPLTKLGWNGTLADLAQTLADSCSFGHGNMETGEYKMGACGQNIAAVTGLKGDYEFMIDYWYDEKLDYDLPSQMCLPGKKCGHYTQIVKDAALYIGCAIADCTPLSFSSGSQWDEGTYLVCNYDVSNIMNEPPYVPDSTCDIACHYRFDDATNLCERCKEGEAGCQPGHCQNSGIYLDAYCEYWASSGMCENDYYQFMKRDCRASCKPMGMCDGC